MSLSEVVRRRAGERDPQEAFETAPRYLQGVLLAWIALSMEESRRTERWVSSYSLKHDAEDDCRIYIGNDTFKGAMLFVGFSPVDGDDLNWHFKIRRRHGRRTSGYGQFKLDRERMDPEELVRFDALASWASMNAGFDSRIRRLRAGYDDPPFPLVREEDLEAFREARRAGLVGGGRISPEVYCAVTGDCRPPRPRLCNCA